MNELLDNAADYYLDLRALSSDNDKANATMAMNYEKVIGPRYDDRLQWVPDEYGPIDAGRTNITFMFSTWTAGPYQCIIINTEKTKVLGVSQQFTFGHIPVNIKVLNDTYYPGQTLYASVSSQNKSSFEEFDSSDYIRIYKVPEDLSNNPLLLNTGGNATFIGNANFGRSSISSIETEIYWQTPGKYRIVLHSTYMQIVRGMSNTFEISGRNRNRNTTIIFNSGSNTIYPGQYVNATIYNPDPPNGLTISTAFIPAKDSVNSYVNKSKTWLSLSRYPIQKWDSGTTNLTVSAYFQRLKWGWYKVVVLAGAGRIVVGVSTQVLVKRPQLQISLPKRTFSRSDYLVLQTYGIDPYFGFTDDYYYYSFEIVPINYTMPQIIQPNWTVSDFTQHGYPIRYGSQIPCYAFSPGLYNIRIFVHRMWWYNYYQQFKLDDVVTIRNTTFQIIK
jgi:hypothetical protein